MTIQRPYNIMANGNMINGITIDAGQSNIISWSNSGDTAVAYDVQIINNTTGSVVFDTNEVTSYSTQYTLAANSIANNQQYKITVTSYDKYNNYATSYAQVFNTSASPVVTIGAIPSPVASQNATFTATYSQANNVPMDSWIVYLYDNNKNLIAQSNIQTTTTIEYTFQGFESGNTYYVEFQCTSNVGLTGSTGQVEFTTQFGQPTQSAKITAVNNDDNGTIELSWSVIQIIGQTDISGTVTYINNEEIDLTGGNNVWFSDGFSVNQNFTLKLWLSNPVQDKNLLTLYGQNGTIYLQFQSDNCFHLYKAPSGSTKIDHYISDSVTSATGSYYVYIQQIETNLNLGAEGL